MKTERELFLESVADKNWIDRNSIKNDYKFLDGKFVALKDEDDDFAVWLNIGWEMWCASASREGYKLVPVECTDETAEAIASVARCCGGIADAIYCAVIESTQLKQLL